MSLIKRKDQFLPELTDFFDDGWYFKPISSHNWIPSVNVIDNEDNYEIELAAPGMKKGDFTVEEENGILTVKGKNEREDEQEEKNYTRKEFNSVSFSRSFTLPDNVSKDDIKAKYADGVLKLTLTKLEKEIPSKKNVAIA